MGDLDAELRDLECEQFGEALYRELARRIERAAVAAAHAGDRREVEDASCAAHAHALQRGACHVEKTEYVSFELALRIGGVLLLERAELSVPRVVNEHIDAAEVLRRLGDRRPGVPFARHVEAQRKQAIGVARERFPDA